MIVRSASQRLALSAAAILAAAVFAFPALAGESAPDTAAVAPALPMTGSGTEDDPYVVDVDALLKGGYGLIVAEEDTIPFAEGTSDTVLVSAPRVGIAEIVRRIGRKMERDALTMGEMTYTALTTVVARKHGEDDPDGEDEYTMYEAADRFSHGEGDVVHSARLWSRERKFRDGEVVDEKVDDEVSAEWEQIAGTTGDIPFSLLTGDAYDYAVVDRKLIGRHLIYAVSFEPRNRFKALPSGTVWIDWSDFAIQRMEGSLEGAMPLPLLIKDVPYFRYRQRQVDRYWVPRDLEAKIVLRKVLPRIPAELELRWEAVDFSIGGREIPDPPRHMPPPRTEPAIPDPEEAEDR